MSHYGRLHRFKGRRTFVDRLLALAFLLSMLGALRPAALDFASSLSVRGVISRMTSTTDATRDAERMRVLSDAQAFNMMLGGPNAKLDNQGNAGGNAGEKDVLCLARQGVAPASDYGNQLCWRGNTTLCWIEVPSCHIVQPVYHGTSEEALAQGAGHLEWSSLPVGGVPSHCVIAGHSGMEQSRMFDDLEVIEEGDVFVIHTLGDSYWYQVFGTEIVTPDEAERKCSLTEDEDLCTLMTCTPYGVNSHRLLVHGRRVRAQSELPAQRSSIRMLSRRRSVPVLALAAGGAALGVAGLVHTLRKRSPRR